MANDVALFTGGGVPALPEHLRGIGVDEQTKKLAGGGGLRISIKGGVWRLLNGGEELAKIDDRHLNAVIVRSSPDTARQYYAGTYAEGDNEAPDCWSADGVVPASDAPKKQSASCATCPQNIAGSGENGESRACKFKRDLAIVLEGDLGGKVFKLSVPAKSLFGKAENGVMPLQAYGKQLVQHNLPINAVVTEMRFDTTSATPKIGWKAVRYLSKEEYEVVKNQGETPEAVQATTTTVHQQDKNEPMNIPGSNPAAASTPAPAAGNEQAATAAPAQKRTRKNAAASGAQAAAQAEAGKPDSSATAPAADSAQTASAPTAAAPVKRMTEKAEFTYEEYLAADWTDEDLIAEGLMVIETPKPAAPPKPKGPPKRTAAQAPAATESTEPVVQQTAASAPPPVVKEIADALAGWDNEEE